MCYYVVQCVRVDDDDDKLWLWLVTKLLYDVSWTKNDDQLIMMMHDAKLLYEHGELLCISVAEMNMD